jgi:monofunctional biosynthetic peptidoglycan transglycosylase
MLKNILVWLLRSAAAFILCTVLILVIFRFVPTSLTPLMVQRVIEAPFKQSSPIINRRWVSYGDVSPWVYRAIIAGEDGRFLAHNGVDWNAVRNAQRVNVARQKHGKPPLGASTLSMQTAKNVFLFPIRSIIRKALEVGFTYGIEFFWGKKRILEVYVNSIEWGNGVYGVQAAARRYFGKDASQITRYEAARLAAVIPNPRKFRVDAPSNYVRRRTEFIAGRMGVAIPK